MRAFRLHALALLALAGCQNDAPPQGCIMVHVATLPLDTTDDGLVTTVRLNGTDIKMLVDTGAELTVVRQAAADRLKLSATRLPDRLYGIGGARYAAVFEAKTFEIGKLHGQNLDMVVSDFAVRPSSGIDGLLGMDFLSQYDIDLDLPDNKIRLFKAVRGCHSVSAALEEPLYPQPMYFQNNGAGPSATIQVAIGGRHVLARIDSGATTTALYRDAKSRAGVTTANLANNQHSYMVGTGPRKVESIEHTVEAITIGDITLNNLPVAIMDTRSDDDTDMLLGLDFLSRVHVWLSFSSHTVVMQYPPKPSPPDPQ